MIDIICTICMSTEHRAHACPHQIRLFDLVDMEPASGPGQDEPPTSTEEQA